MCLQMKMQILADVLTVANSRWCACKLSLMCLQTVADVLANCHWYACKSPLMCLQTVADVLADADPRHLLVAACPSVRRSEGEEQGLPGHRAFRLHHLRGPDEEPAPHPASGPQGG